VSKVEAIQPSPIIANDLVGVTIVLYFIGLAIVMYLKKSNNTVAVRHCT